MLISNEIIRWNVSFISKLRLRFDCGTVLIITATKVHMHMHKP